MRSKKCNGGIITYHVPFNIGLVTSEAPEPKCVRAEVRLSAPVKKRNACGCGKQVKRVDTSATVDGSRPRRGYLSSYASNRRLQAKMEVESREMKELIQPLLDTEKEFQSILIRHEEAKVLRRERMRKCWKEDIWSPIQKKMDQHMFTCNPLETNMRQNLYDQYLHHGNAKGFVFLDTCDLKEYNPYLLHTEKPHRCKLNAAKMKETELHGRSKQKRPARCEAGRCQYKWISQSEPQPPEAHVQSLDATKSVSDDRMNIPFHIRETATPDGRCHHHSCWFSTH
ncbi:protein FAM228A [Dunckerocampus dactyliophorus]|uniref:protein FAM228A n=1 Tax=Dunckerocampus dactyliophorus TaxID=161453 RepID=UPI002405A70E|nr:protein FAM228A [Dunckerocampus dactyliophorus]